MITLCIIWCINAALLAVSNTCKMRLLHVRAEGPLRRSVRLLTTGAAVMRVYLLLTELSFAAVWFLQIRDGFSFRHIIIMLLFIAINYTLLRTRLAFPQRFIENLSETVLEVLLAPFIWPHLPIQKLGLYHRSDNFIGYELGENRRLPLPLVDAAWYMTILSNITELHRVSVQEVAEPMVNIETIDGKSTLKEALTAAKKGGRDLLLVQGEKECYIDGYISIKQFADRSEGQKISDRVRQAAFVYEDQNLDILLHKMREADSEVAVVVDEYGGADGVIFLEDVARHIFEMGEPLDANRLTRGRRNVYYVDADVDIDDINQQLDTSLPKDDYETIGGLMIHELKRIPVKGDRVNIKGTRLTVREATQHKIIRIRMDL